MKTNSRQRVSKVKALAVRAGTPGEQQAAEAALSRISAGEVRERLRLTDAVVASRPVPVKGNRVHYDRPNARGNDYVPGFGVRITESGHRSFVLNYRTKGGTDRRLTIGSPPTWTVPAARERAKELRREVDSGGDPVQREREARGAESVNDLCDRFIAEHLPKKREATQHEYKLIITKWIKPELGSMKVANVDFSDVDRLHRKITKTAPYRANRTVAVMSKMFSLSVLWKMRTDNPCKSIERNDERPRERYLTDKESKALQRAIDAYNDQNTAFAVRLMLYTGSRRGETLAAQWAQFDLTKGVWTKPSAHTKTKRDHKIPLSAAARDMLRKMRKAVPDDAEWLFPSNTGTHRVSLNTAWRAICKAAGITKLRVHDLRHNFASVLAADQKSLPIIGALLGHTQSQTTQRYVHLVDAALRQATESAGAAIIKRRQ